MNINTKEIEVNELYSTSDLSLAAVISLSFPLEAIDKSQNPHKALFIFKRDNELELLIQDYWKGKISVNPQEYFNALKGIKARLYESK